MNTIIFIVLIFINLNWFYNKQRKSEVKHKLFYLALLVIHFSSFLLFYNISIEIERDSFLFYYNALKANSIFEFKIIGSQFMSIIAYPFAKIGVSYFSLSLLFASISFYIFIEYSEYFFTLNCRNNLLVQTSVILLFLTPSLHYWTAGLSKECLLVFLMGVIFFHISKNKLFSLKLIIAMFFVLLIRPYVFAVLIFSFGLHIIVSKHVSVKIKKRFIFFTIISFLASISVLKQFISIDVLSIEEFTQKFKDLTLYSNANGQSSINLKESNYFGRMFLVLLRPFFYDAKSLFQYIISIENLLFLFILLKFTHDFLKRKVKVFFKKDVFILSTTIFLIIFYSIYMYNLGLASRMRCMFIPYLYLFIFLSYFRTRDNYEEKAS